MDKSRELYKRNLFVHNVTAIFLILDVLYLASYCVVIVFAIVGGNQVVENDGFMALGSPHIAIIPALVTILANVRGALRDNKRGVATQLNVDAGWFLMPVLSVPYDCLEIIQSFYTQPFALDGTIVFVYGASISLTLSAWTIWLFVSVNGREAMSLGAELKEGVQYLVKPRLMQL